MEFIQKYVTFYSKVTIRVVRDVESNAKSNSDNQTILSLSLSLLPSKYQGYAFLRWLLLSYETFVQPFLAYC